MKAGSALLSLVVGMLIASIVCIALINSLHQFISINTVVNNSVDQTKRLIVAHEQLEKDIIGGCIPHQAARNTRKDSEKKNAKNDSEKNKPVRTKESEKKEKEKPLKEAFFFKGNPTEQIIFSCITNNGKSPYWPKQTVTNASFLKRITYHVEKDPNNKKSFRLMRYESPDFTFFMPQKSIVLLDHIASMSISASYQTYVKEKKAQPKPDQKSEKKKAKQKEKTATSFKATQQWNDTFVYEQTDELVSRIPESITITYELFDNQYKKTSRHTQTIRLMSNGFYGPTRKEASFQTPQLPTEPKDPMKIPKPSVGSDGPKPVTNNNNNGPVTSKNQPTRVADQGKNPFSNPFSGLNSPKKIRF